MEEEEEESMMQCPYNAAHTILKHRMAAHLIKCRQQYPSDNFSTCPFNATHDVPTRELQYHTKNCADRRKLDSFLYVSDDIKPRPEDFNDIELPSSNENWDEETSARGSYLDIKNKIVQSQPLLRIPVGMSRSKRKIFFHQEAKKFASISIKDN